MRDGTTPFFKELGATGSTALSVTPGSVATPATFNMTGLPPVSPDGQHNYAQAIWCHVQLAFNPDAAGSAVDWDRLYKAVASFRVTSQWLGDVFSPSHTRGVVAGHIIGPLASGYRYPMSARAQIPASTDTTLTVDLYYKLPLSYECLKKPKETAQWVGFFENGIFEVLIGTTTVFDGDYAGAVIEAPITVRAWMEYEPSPDLYLGVPVQWRERVIAGGGPQTQLMSVGQETNWNGVQAGCGLMWLSWLADPGNLGLGGASSVDNLTSYEAAWRGQQQIQNLDPLFISLRQATRGRVAPIAGLGTTIMADGGGWPYTMDATPNGRVAGQSTAMFLPLVFPGNEFETSKAQRVLGNLQINSTATSTISNAHRYVSCELMEFTDTQVQRLKVAMGIPPSFKSGRKSLYDNSIAHEDARYTRILFHE
jgi:hypothetical protein